MISIKQSVSALEQSQGALQTILTCYRATILDLATYTVTLDDESTEAHRKHLTEIAKQVTEAPPAEFPEYRTRLERLLAGYQDEGARYVDELLQGRVRTEQAFQEFIATLTQANDDHDGIVRMTLNQMRGLARSPLGRNVGPLLLAMAEKMEKSLEQIRKEHQVMITKHQNEIRMLRKQIDPSPSEAVIGCLTTVFSRSEILEQIRSANAGQFSLLLVRARGFRVVESQFDSDVATQLAHAIVSRLRNILPLNASIGRWGEEEFIGLNFRRQPDADMRSSIGRSEIEKLSGQYACQQDGKDVRPSLAISVCVVDTSSRDAGEVIIARVESSFSQI
jgi:GGDEF domain-containing protein